MKLSGLGYVKVFNLKKDIKYKLLNEGYCIPRNNLPMQAVTDILKMI